MKGLGRPAASQSNDTVPGSMGKDMFVGSVMSTGSSGFRIQSLNETNIRVEKVTHSKEINTLFKSTVTQIPILFDRKEA